MSSASDKTSDPLFNLSPEHDEKYMRIALGMARRGLGQTSPNPSVGAVIIMATGEKHYILGRGTTGENGIPHAEPRAIENSVRNALEITKSEPETENALNSSCLYVTLEPCNHFGRTPPCTQAIINAGIKRVVIASSDPDERVSGSGIARLRQAGIEVIKGICRKEADYINAGHILRQTQKRPYLILKSAIAANGLIKKAMDGKPQWVTSIAARNRGHLLRAECDAILIGRATAEQDNPTLTCRLPGMENHSPQPIIIDQNLNLPANLKLFEKAAPTDSDQKRVTWVICSDQLSNEKKTAYQQTRHVRLIPAALNKHNRIDLKAMLENLTNEGVTRLLIEGGPTTSKAFFEQTPVDQFNLFKGSKPAPEDGFLPLVDKPFTWPIETFGMTLNHQQKLGHNIMYQYQTS